jgi:c-di-GMP-binding flagellar brake protein YcgR
MSDDERRAHYRVDLAEGEILVALIVPGYPGGVNVEAFDISMGGAGIRLRATIAKLLSAGMTVSIEFPVPDSAAGAVRTSAVVTHVTAREDDTSSIGVQFEDPVGLQRLLPPDLVRLFNRRKAFRVEPAIGDRVPVRVVPARPALGVKPGQGTMLEISATGMGILVAPALAKMYLKVLAVTVTFKLPGAAADLAISASIRARREVPEGIRWGLFFEGRGTKDWATAERLVSAYLLKRQIQQRNG